MRRKALAALLGTAIAVSVPALPSNLMGSSGWSQGLATIEYSLGPGTAAVGGLAVWNPPDKMSFGFGVQYKMAGSGRNDFPVTLYLDMRAFPFFPSEPSLALPLVLRLGVDLSDKDGSLWVDAGVAAVWFVGLQARGAVAPPGAREGSTGR